MPHKLPPLNAIRAFEAAARHRSFKKAAQELFVTPAAISYQIRQLEQQLGVQLFERENRKVILTADAQRCLPYLSNGFEQISRGIGKLVESRQPQRFIVAAGPAFTVKWLAPGLQQFTRQHSDINVSVMASIDLADFRNDGVDAAIRFGNLDHSGLYSEKLADETLVPMCSPGWLAQQKPLEDARDLFSLPLIHDDSIFFAPEVPGWDTVAEKLGLPEAEAQKGLRFNQADHALQAAMDGAGVLLGRRVLATPDLQAGRLVTLFPELEMEVGMAHHFVCLKEKADLYQIRTFQQWLQQLLQPAFQRD
ncbi:transcriptional regulator GcvA [Marinobacterium jannaschii]|uniref:transcriptional regulator GcvA n=1 Tax=Marinobacterium jannaschii TaxID=64970 RepID=UPI000487D060|nr:transcriptional regulator GcvA [Marinobacterium jannaschii]